MYFAKCYYSNFYNHAAEFLLGRRLLVAPVLDEGATSQDVYLPRGVWLDLNTAQQHEGPAWLRDYPAPLSLLPHFQLISSETP